MASEGAGGLTGACEPHPAQPGTWVRMPPDCRHSVTARTPLVMALYLLPTVAGGR